MPSSNESSSTTGKRVRLTYCIGTPATSGKGRGVHKGLNLSRTWVNKSLNKSRVLTRSLRTNNRTLAKKLNTVQMELSQAEEQLTNLRDAHESLQQDNRLKESCLADVFSQVGELTQGLVLLAKRVEEGLGGVNPHSHLVPSPLPLNRLIVLSDMEAPVQPKMETDEDPFIARDRIPRTPPYTVSNGDADRCQQGSVMSIITESPHKPKQQTDARRGNPAMLAEKMLNELMSQTGAPVDEDADSHAAPPSPPLSPEPEEQRLPTRIIVSPSKPPTRKAPRREEEDVEVEVTKEAAAKQRRRKSAVDALTQMWPGVDPALGRRRSSLEAVDRALAETAKKGVKKLKVVKRGKPRRRSKEGEDGGSGSPVKGKRGRQKRVSVEALTIPVVDSEEEEEESGDKVTEVKKGRGRRESVEAEEAPPTPSVDLDAQESPLKVKRGRPRRLSIEVPSEEPLTIPGVEAGEEESPQKGMRRCRPRKLSIERPTEDLPAPSPVDAGEEESPQKVVKRGRQRKLSIEPPSEDLPPTASEGLRKEESLQKMVKRGRQRRLSIDTPPDDPLSSAPVDLDDEDRPQDAPISKQRKSRRSVELEAKPTAQDEFSRQKPPVKPGRHRKSLPEPSPEPQSLQESTVTNAVGTALKAGRKKNRKVMEESSQEAVTAHAPAISHKSGSVKPGRHRKLVDLDMHQNNASEDGSGSRVLVVVKQRKPRRSREVLKSGTTPPPRRSASEPGLAELDDVQALKLTASEKGKLYLVAKGKRASPEPAETQDTSVISPIQVDRGRSRLSGTLALVVPDSIGKTKKGKVHRRSLSSPGKLSPAPRTIQVATKKPGVLKFSTHRHGMEKSAAQGKRKKKGRPPKVDKMVKDVMAEVHPKPVKTVYDFSFNDTMNKTGKQLPATLSEFREKNEVVQTLNKEPPVDKESSGDSVQTSAPMAAPRQKPTSKAPTKTTGEKVKKGRRPAKDKNALRPLNERQFLTTAPSPAPSCPSEVDPRDSSHPDDEDVFQTRPPSRNSKRRFRRLVTFDDSVFGGEDDADFAAKRQRLVTPTDEPIDEDPSDVENKAARSRRVRAMNYKEPCMNKKVRRGDPLWCRS